MTDEQRIRDLAQALAALHNVNSVDASAFAIRIARRIDALLCGIEPHPDGRHPDINRTTS